MTKECSRHSSLHCGNPGPTPEPKMDDNETVTYQLIVMELDKKIIGHYILGPTPEPKMDDNDADAIAYYLPGRTPKPKIVDNETVTLELMVKKLDKKIEELTAKVDKLGHCAN